MFGRNFKFVVLIDLLTAAFSVIDVRPNQPVVVNISGRSNNSVVLQNLSTDISHVTFQVHSQTKNITLSPTPEPAAGKSLTGVDVGIVTILGTNQTEVACYVLSNHSEEVQVLLAVYLMSGNTPVVGGCNLEFSLETDANLLVSYTTTRNRVEFQWSNVPLGPRSTPRLIIPQCEDQAYQDTLEYSVYVRYLSGEDLSPGGYFTALQQMLTAEDVMSNGIQLSSITNKVSSQKPEFHIASYPGTGAVYNVVVKVTTPAGVTMAAYFPQVTYSCNLQQRSSCHMYGLFWKLSAVVLGLVGLFLNFLGHRFFRTGNFLCAFLGFCIIFYSIFTLSTGQSDTVVLILTAVLGVVCAALWLGMFEFIGSAAISVLLTGLVAGYLISSIVFYTKFGNLSYWDKPFNYGMAFACGVLAIPVFILAYTKVLNIVACSFIGSYLMILVPDVFLHSGMKYIVVNSLRHSTDVDYVSVINIGPFLVTEIILSVVWFLLCVGGAFVQFYSNWGLPDFPESARTCGKKVHQVNHNRVPARYSVEPEDDEPGNDEPDERSPLLRQTVNERHRRNKVAAAPT